MTFKKGKNKWYLKKKYKLQSKEKKKLFGVPI